MKIEKCAAKFLWSIMICFFLFFSVSSIAGAESEIDDYLKDARFSMYSHDGLIIPLLDGEGWETNNLYTMGYGRRSSYGIELREKKNELVIYNEFSVKDLNTFYEDPDEAPKCYSSTLVTGKNMEQEMIQIDGHPAMIAVYDQYNTDYFANHHGVLYYVRQNRLLQIHLYTQFRRLKDRVIPENVPRVSLDDMRKIAEQISYDISQAPVTEEDVAISIVSKDEAKAVSAGKTLELDVAFIHPDIAKSQASSVNYEQFVWSATDVDTGEELDLVEMMNKTRIKYDRRGGVERGRASMASAMVPSNHQKIKVLNKLDRVIHAEIIAESSLFHTKAAWPLTLLPTVKKITLEPAAVTLYAGTDMSVEVKVTLEPENPFTGITWKAAREGIVEIEPGEDGTAILRPVARGKTAVTVTEPGGKKANVTVVVTSPVEQVELNASGKAKPGKTITVRTTLLPKTAGVKDVEWFVDTDESIASVNSKGQVSIAKDTPTGTVVTVTCKALGAPEPVNAELKIIVE